MNDVTDAFDPDWLVDIEIKRTEAGEYVDGRWQEGWLNLVEIKAVVQRPSARDLLVLPGGLRTESVIKLHSTSILQGVSENDETTADKFEYEGGNYMVHSVTAQSVGVYYKALAIRQYA